MDGQDRITQLLDGVANGCHESADRLFSIVYSELKKLAESQMKRESVNNTLQSTALVSEVWLKLIGQRENKNWNSRGHFFATAAQAMRRILVDAARGRLRLKRGGDREKFELRDDDLVVFSDEKLLALNESLQRLQLIYPDKAKLVELRFFAGLTIAQSAEQLDISTATAERHWRFAKAWLRARVEGD